MLEINEHEIKEIQLGLLSKFASICRENKLQYWLYYGTLIGAVRHNGFIPWDDDVDIAMPRQDYNKLCALFGNQIIDNRFQLLTPNDSNYIYPFLKFVDIRTHIKEKWMLTNILGVYIDIFPIDGLPESQKKYHSTILKMKIYHYLLLLTSRKRKKRKKLIRTIVSNILYYPLSLFGYNIWKNKIIENAERIDYSTAKSVGNLSIDTYIDKECFNSKWFAKSKLVKFEDDLYPIPVGYHEILTKLYGNYMQLPAIEKRTKAHDNIAYWI